MRGSHRPYLVLFVAGCALRVLYVFLRGDFLGFDEALYSVLGRNLLAGKGYQLNGMAHLHFPPGIPILSALSQMAISDPARAMAAIQALAAIAALIPIAALYRRFLPPRTALSAFALACLAPALAFPLPFGHSYSEWFTNGSEPVFLALVTASLAILCRPGKRAGWRALLGGMVMGLATLVRDEGPLFLVPALAWIIFARPHPAHRRRAAASGLLVVCGWTAVLVPNIIRLHQVTGRWMVSGKAEGGTPDHLFLDEIFTVLRDDDWLPFVRKHHGLNAEGTQITGFYEAAAPRDPAGAESAPLPPRLAAHALTVLRGNWDLFPAVLRRLLPLPLWPFFLAGAYGWLRASRTRVNRHGFWPLWLFFPAVAISGAVPLHTRYVFFLIPLLLAAVASGISETLRWLPLPRRPGWRPRHVRACLVGAACGFLLLSEVKAVTLALLGVPHATSYYREIGEILSEEVEPSAPIMSHYPHAALFSHRPWRLLPFDTFDRVIHYARLRGVRYVLFEPYRTRRDNLPFSQALPGGTEKGFALVELLPARFSELSFRVGKTRAVRAGNDRFPLKTTLTTVELSGPW